MTSSGCMLHCQPLPCLSRAPTALDPPLHANIEYMAASGGGFLRQPKPRLPDAGGAGLSMVRRDLGDPGRCGQRRLRAHFYPVQIQTVEVLRSIECSRRYLCAQKKQTLALNLAKAATAFTQGG